jgi:hypothetical protein
VQRRGLFLYRLFLKPAAREFDVSYSQYEKKVDYAEIFVNIVSLGVRDFLPAAQGNKSATREPGD